MSGYQIDVERDSVCMGDDAHAPHSYSFKVSTQARLTDVFAHLASEAYLASVSGKNHSWEAFIQNENVALFKGNNRQPESSPVLSHEVSQYVHDGKLALYFKYNSARD